jgi:hypothetical protein
MLAYPRQTKSFRDVFGDILREVFREFVREVFGGFVREVFVKFVVCFSGAVDVSAEFCCEVVWSHRSRESLKILHKKSTANFTAGPAWSYQSTWPPLINLSLYFAESM